MFSSFGTLKIVCSVGGRIKTIIFDNDVHLRVTLPHHGLFVQSHVKISRAVADLDDQVLRLFVNRHPVFREKRIPCIMEVRFADVPPLACHIEQQHLHVVQ